MKYWEPLKINSWKNIWKLLYLSKQSFGFKKLTYSQYVKNKKSNFLFYVRSKKDLAWIKDIKYLHYDTLKYYSVIGAGGISFWLGYQYKNTVKRIGNIVRTDALNLDIKRCEYIYLDSKAIKDKLGIEIIDKNGNLQPSETPSIYVQLWNSYKRSTPWRLLRLCQSKSFSGRQKAVRDLAVLRDLEDVDYTQLAQAIDPKTAVALARTPNVDERLFLPPKKSMTANDINGKLRVLLEHLNQNVEHSCVDYIIKTAFADYNYDQGTELNAYWLEQLQIPYHLRRIDPDNVIELSLRSLVHHCSLSDHTHLPVDFVKCGGLSVLMDVYKTFHSNEDIVALICELLFLCSLHPQLLNHIFSEGWIGVLAKLLKKNNVRIRSWAGKILSNLDSDSTPSCDKSSPFQKEVFLLHPVHRANPSQRLDIVLIHGLLGNVFFTWRQRDAASDKPLDLFAVQPTQGQYEKFDKPFSRPILPPLLDDFPNEFLEIMNQLRSEEWNNIGSDFELVFSDCPIKSNYNSNGPFSTVGTNIKYQKDHIVQEYSQCWPYDWLITDIKSKSFRMFGINYETTLSEWLPICPQADPSKRKLEDRSEQILDQLLSNGVGDRPILFIAHSMGGLVVKNMLSIAWQKRNEEKYRKFLNQTKSVLFFSTPHKGSSMATLNHAYRFLFLPSVEVDEMRLDSPILQRLHKDFLDVANATRMKVVSFAETQSTVFSSSLKINIQLVPFPFSDPNIGELYEIPLDHMNICKPDSKQSFIYQKVLQCVQEVLQQPPEFNSTIIINDKI